MEIVSIKKKIVGIKETPLSMVLIIVAVFLSLFFAYVTFNMLQSSGEVTGQEAFWGASAVFIVIFMALTTSTSKLHGLMTSDRLSKIDDTERSQKNKNDILDQMMEYNKKIQELQEKLIKRSQGPPYYITEMDEAHKIVFNRPEQWLPKDGVIYRYVKKRTDAFPAKFEMIYRDQNELSEIYNQFSLGNFDPEDVDIDEIYDITTNFDLDIFKSDINSFEDLKLVKEYITVDGIKSLKQTLSYTISAPNGDKIRMRQSRVHIYVKRLKTFYQLNFVDDDEHYLNSSEIFNHIIESIQFL